MPVDLVEKIEMLAEREHRDRSSMIIHLLSVCIAERELEETKQKQMRPLLKVEEGWVD